MAGKLWKGHIDGHILRTRGQRRTTTSRICWLTAITVEITGMTTAWKRLVHQSSSGLSRDAT